MKFSILVANYNNGKFFKDCYNSVLLQTYTNWEVIIVDDGSTDDSVEIIKSIIKEDKRFLLDHYPDNKGCGYAKKKCVELSNGEIAGFVDPDDALLPNALEEMYNGFMNNAGAVLIHSGFNYCNDVLKEIKSYSKAASVHDKSTDFFNIDHSVTAFATFKISEYKKTEGLDPYLKRAVDQDLYLKMFEAGAFHFIDKPLYLYRRHCKSISSDENIEKSQYWHWYVIMQAAKRRNINAEDYFINFFVNRKRLDRLQKKFYNNPLYRMYKFFGRK